MHQKTILISCFCVVLILLVSFFANIYFLRNVYFTEDPRRSQRLQIYFLETKWNKRHVLPHQACAVESAAFHHQTNLITFYNVNGEFKSTDKYVQLLSTIPNVRLLPLNARDVFIGSPLEMWYSGESINRSLFPTVHLSDALRLAILWKNGGIYMDTDSITIRSLRHLRNSIGLELDGVANGVLIFDKNSPFLKQYMEQFVKDFQGHLWAHQGPKMATKVLRRICKSNSLQTVINKPTKCEGIRILPTEAFYPLLWTQWEFLLRNNTRLDLSKSFTVHLYGRISQRHSKKAEKGFYLDKLYKKHCPLSYQLMAE